MTTFAVGTVFLAVSVVASLILALGHIGAIGVPGCGEDSPCAKAAASAWGAVPGINWSTAFLGLAYFAGALAAWIRSRNGIVPLFRWVARLGALASLGFLLVILIEGHHCSYCLVSHGGNLAFWILVERTRSARLPRLQPVMTLAVVFLIVSAILGVAERLEKARVMEGGERDRAESSAQIIAASQRDGDQGDLDYPWEGDFCGRFVYGPKKAPIRLLLYTDYQCAQCNKVEEEVRVLIEQRDDISLTTKHFPMNSSCNSHFSRVMHANACWAARAAEAAGILRGSEGFWQMHFWLFDVDGGFSSTELNQALREFGYDSAEFINVMTGDEALANVHSDIEEAVWLGLHYTPMIFINGVELKGIMVPNAVTRTVNELAATNPPARSHAVDKPPPAAEKYVADWREKPVRTIPPDSHPWGIGPADAKAKVVVWGDYQEVNSAKAAQRIEEIVSRLGDVHFTFRHYPANQDCNPGIEVHKHPLACVAARAVEAAGLLGGQDAYWRMHTWLLQNQELLNEDTIGDVAAGMGHDPEAFLAAMQNPAVEAAIIEDCRAGSRMGITSIPHVVINGKFLPRWEREDSNTLELVISEARGATN
ncbi:DsbA family protein [Candidatus Eisenbacteria bacterium]|uniref:DsbA family protein n=1 Tax=Eiseniibacteriota bacterium TaxID=2212470 RepID=A0ABV6YJZ2_UNCEI